MNLSKLLLTAFLFFSSLSSHSECTKLIDVIGVAAQNNGLVFPLERENVVILHYLRIIPFEVINSPAKYYVEDRGREYVRVFTIKNGCADLQWMIPRDFLILIGIKRTLV